MSEGGASRQDKSYASDDCSPSEHWVIAGAGSGVGLGIAERLAGLGAKVTACVRCDDEARVVIEQIPDSTLVSVQAFDVRDSEGPSAAAAFVDAPVDVLVVCTGVFGGHHSVKELDFDEALEMFSINTLGPLRVIQAFLPLLLKGYNPRIALMSSVLGSMADGGCGKHKNISYRASKAALNKYVQGMALDLKDNGVTVVALEPGWVRTSIGGSKAPLSVEESASGIVTSIRSLSIEGTGTFFDYQSRNVPW